MFFKIYTWLKDTKANYQLHHFLDIKIVYIVMIK